MSAIGFILLVIFLWFFYNMFVKVLLPVYKTARQIKAQFRNMSNQQRPEQHTNQRPQPAASPKPKTGEYIDFEEVK